LIWNERISPEPGSSVGPVSPSFDRLRLLDVLRPPWKGRGGNRSRVRGVGMQSIPDLEARALHHAQALDSVRRTLRTQALHRLNRPGVVDRGEPRAAEDPVEPLHLEEARTAARLKIAVDELLAAHCEQLRLSAWGQRLLVPAETALLEANEAYLPWERVLRFGKLALEEIRALGAASSASERVEGEHRVEDATQGLANGIDILARQRPDSELPLLKADVARSLDRDVEILAAMDSVATQSIAERMAVVKAQADLELANQQIVAAAWAKIPPILRP